MTRIKANVPLKCHTGAKRLFSSISQNKGTLRFNDNPVMPFIFFPGYRGY